MYKMTLISLSAGLLAACQAFTDAPINHNIQVVNARPVPDYNHNVATIYDYDVNSNQGRRIDPSKPSRVVTYSQGRNEVLAEDTKIVASANGVKSKTPTVSIEKKIVVPKRYAKPLVASQYRIVEGDTLYSIAFRYGLDYRNLAKLNKIDPPYNISVGQLISLNIKEAQAPVYIVKKGDTIYSIAKANGQTIAFLAGANDLNPPYTLQIGQKLNLARGVTKQKKVKSDNVIVAKSKTPTKISKNEVVTKPKQESVSTITPISSKVYSTKGRNVGGVFWSWPSNGKVVEGFSIKEQGNKGIDIAGSRGSRILAASDGQVVYAGNALRGYGNLIIINHKNEYLSAYAHNDKIHVKEGQKVKRGQQIADMGSTDSNTVKLHFEIRYRGQSVNPVSYLPKK